MRRVTRVALVVVLVDLLLVATSAAQVAGDADAATTENAATSDTATSDTAASDTATTDAPTTDAVERIAALEERLRDAEESERRLLDLEQRLEALEGTSSSDAPALTHRVEPWGIRFVPGKGLELASADGRFQLRTRVRVQFRWTGLSREGEDLAQQFRLRRARVVFSGHTFSENVRFALEIALSPNDVGIRDDFGEGELSRPRLSPLLSFFVDFRVFRDLEIRIGQYKIPSNRQRVISSGNLQLVDRSLLNSEFTLDRDVGIDIHSKDFLGLDRLRYVAGVYIARGRDSQGFDDFGMAYLARVEYLPLGLFNDYSEVDFDRGAPRLSLGLGWAHIDRARTDRGIIGSVPSDGGTTDTQHIFADASFKARGFSVLTEFAWRRGWRNPGTLGDVAPARDGVGFHLQAGYLLRRVPIEFAARYGLIRGRGEESALADRNELVLGVSYYAALHPYKFQVDYTRLWGPEVANDHRVRVQIQVSL